MPAFTLVSLHAHPDDEALLTGGTLARAVSEGHRVVLVVATAGEAGLASSALTRDGYLGGRRLAELARSARALGVHRVVNLGYADSGWRQSAVDGDVFSRLDPREAAEPLTALLREERADVLTTYDPAGGYGHPDHVQVHRVGSAAAAAAGTSSVLEATVDRERISRAVRWAAHVPGLLDSVDPAAFDTAFAPRACLTHQVDVRSHLAAKRRAMQAHGSQATTDDGTRTLRLLLRLPPWLFARVAGKEWFIERGRTPGRCDDVFASVRGR